MGTRYVWEKWNALYALVTRSLSNGNYAERLGDSNLSDYTMYLWDYGTTTPTFDPSTGQFSGVTTPSTYDDYASLGSYCSLTKNHWYKVSFVQNGRSTYAPSANYGIYYRCTSGTGKLKFDSSGNVVNSGSYTIDTLNDGDRIVKGTTQYADVSSSNSGAYPSNGNPTSYGAYYYVLRGNDCVDPESVSIPASISGTETDSVTATVTPNYSNVYGGTIQYQYDYSMDGGSTWTTHAKTDATSASIPLPDGAKSFKVRVQASDDMGFTSTDYVYTSAVAVAWNTAPTVPGSITVPDQIVAGRSFTLSCGASSDEDGNLSGYSWERQYDGGAWVEFSTGAEPSVSTSVPVGTTSVAYRVRAYDTDAAYSDYCTGETRTVINNTAPVISGADSDLGTFGLTPPGAIDYTVTDVDGGAVNCTVTLDGAVVQEGAVELGAANSYAITASQWLSMLNGAHKIVITADDEYGATAVRTYTFTKDVAALSVTLAEPWITDGRVARMYILPVWSVPDGATVQVLATNNALDAEPVWQDVTDAVKLGKKFYFANEVKTADQWAVNFKVLADRGTADQVYIKKLTGAFDGIGGT